MYITFVEYNTLYDGMEETDFNRLSLEACRVMDVHTTGIDNIKKLKRFFPVDEDDEQTVKHCAAKLIHTLSQIDRAEIAAINSIGYESTENGMRGKVISSISAGNESISYVTGGGSSATAIDAAVKDKTARDRLLAGIVWDYLRGVEDANGVSLLYMGMYPRGLL